MNLNNVNLKSEGGSIYIDWSDRNPDWFLSSKLSVILFLFRVAITIRTSFSMDEFYAISLSKYSIELSISVIKLNQRVNAYSISIN